MNILKRDEMTLDGGLGTELIKFGHEEIDKPVIDPLWSARLLKSDPNAIYEAHLRFLNAGADVIETVTYQASLQGFEKYFGMNNVEAVTLMKEAVQLAFRARKDYLKERNNVGAPVENLPLIAGSVGPYGAWLNDHSEYDGAYVDTTDAELIYQWHYPRVQILVESGVDCLAFETIPAIEEARILLQILNKFPNAKAWIAFSCKDEVHLCNGDKFSDAVSNISNNSQLLAVGINCTRPCYITPLLKSVANRGTPFIVYPNGPHGGGVPSNEIEQTFSESQIKEWSSLGATWIGGCCGVTASMIEMIKTRRFSGQI